MCISSKGKGYDPADVVKEAIAATGWTTHAFFVNAIRHTGHNGFDAEAAAASFDASVADPGKSIELPRPVVTFADWVLTKTSHEIHRKYNANPSH